MTGASVGSATQPVYIDGNGYPVATTGVNYSVDASVTSGTIDNLAVYTSGKPGLTGSVNLTKKSEGIGSEIPGG